MKTIGCFILVIFVAYLLFNPIHAQDAIKGFTDSKNFDFYKSLGLVLTSIISLVNFVVILVFFISERKFKVRLKDYERKAFWYRKMVIEKYLDELKSVFDGVIESNVFNTDQEEMDFISGVRAKRLECIKIINKINETILIFDVLLFKKIEKIKLDFTDIFMHKAEILYNLKGRSTGILEYTNKQKIEIMDVLYKYEIFDYNHTGGFWERLIKWIKVN